VITVKGIEGTIKEAKDAGKPRKLFDPGGLYVRASPGGHVSWNLKYRWQGKERILPFGKWPDVTIVDAREQANECQKKIRKGIDPQAEIIQEKAVILAASNNTFQTLAQEWLARQDGTENTARRREGRLNKFVYPEIGHRPISEITTPELLAVLRKIEDQGKLHTVKRVLRICSKIWSFAIIEGKCQFNVSLPLHEKGVLQTRKTVSHAAITKPSELAVMLNKIDAYSGSASVTACLKLLALVFTRPGELRLAKWSEFDLDKAMWIIPAERMKMRKEFMVPLAKQSVKILKELKKGAESDFVFPGLRQPIKDKPGQYSVKPISENSMNHALQRMGYTHDVHVSHGFRATASTLLHEVGNDGSVIELALAHKVPGVAGIYNRAAKLRERKKLTQSWANYLDKIKKEAA